MLGRAHRQVVFGRRVRVLAEFLAARNSAGRWAVLDVGCGDGSIAKLVTLNKPGVSVEGIGNLRRAEIARSNANPSTAERSPTLTPHSTYACLVDVLHHVPDLAWDYAPAVRKRAA